MRIGHGYDVHKLVPNRKCIIGGVTIPHETGLLGHSDADVLLHAIMDALLGACALGDIGHLFPDNDPKFEGADSLTLLKEVGKHLSDHGWTLGNLDATIVAPYIPHMRENIANALDVNVCQISVKATTEEGLGFTGSRQGIAAHAVCLVLPTA